LIRHNWNKKFKIGGNRTQLKGTLESSIDGPQHQRNASLSSNFYFAATLLITPLCFG
jgi:hypothetical protein